VRLNAAPTLHGRFSERPNRYVLKPAIILKLGNLMPGYSCIHTIAPLPSQLYQPGFGGISPLDPAMAKALSGDKAKLMFA
jgi:hypothetical protein